MPVENENPLPHTLSGSEAWRAGVGRLHPARIVGHPTAQGWEKFVQDCRAFVVGEWADKAAALGWEARQLFGCHRGRPHICNWWGALWFLRDGEIVAMTETLMRFKMIRGPMQSYRKMEHPV